MIHFEDTAGEHSRTAKLTERDIREIRRRRAAGETCVSIAKRFGITDSYCSRIARRGCWRCVA